MAQNPIAEPVFDKGRDRWRVTIPATVSPDGKRTRSWHKTRNAARTYIDALTGKQAEPAAVIAPSLAMKADEARLILEPWDLDLVAAARQLAEALKILNGSGSIVEAAKAFRATHEARHASKPLADAVALYLDSRGDLREATLKSYRYTLEDVIGELEAKNLSDITTAELEALLSKKAPTARAMHQRNLRAFWRWASKPPREWAMTATVESLEAPRISKEEDIEILRQDEVAALMKAAEEEGPKAAVCYAIAVFAGVRMAELSRLTVRDIREDDIEIGRHAAKKTSRRLVPICTTLRAWLDAYFTNEEQESPIVPPNWEDRSKSVRRRAGWEVEARLLSEKEMQEKPVRGPWPSNACRHTCASVQVAIGTPIDDLIFKFGHRGGHDLLRAHYVSRLTKKEALSILSIGPKGRKLKIGDQATAN